MKKLKEQLELQKDIDVPYEVWVIFGEAAKYIGIAGQQASLGGDFMEIEQIRKALEWYADQAGGTISWKDEK